MDWGHILLALVILVMAAALLRNPRVITRDRVIQNHQPAQIVEKVVTVEKPSRWPRVIVREKLVAAPAPEPTPVVVPRPELLQPAAMREPKDVITVQYRDQNEKKIRASVQMAAHLRRPTMFYGDRKYMAARQDGSIHIYREVMH